MAYATTLISRSLGTRSSENTFCFDDFYGDPKCGLISEKNDWAIIAGEHLTVWRKNEKKKDKIVRIENDELKWIHDLRLKNEKIIEILTDPWSNNSAIWELDIEKMQYVKVSDFKKLEIFKNIKFLYISLTI